MFTLLAMCLHSNPWKMMSIITIRSFVNLLPNDRPADCVAMCKHFPNKNLQNSLVGEEEAVVVSMSISPWHQSLSLDYEACLLQSKELMSKPLTMISSRYGIPSLFKTILLKRLPLGSIPMYWCTCSIVRVTITADP